MGTITLTLPVAGTVAVAGLVANDMTTIQNVINGNIDNNNFAAGKIFDPAKLMQNAAVDGDPLVWDNSNSKWVPASTIAAAKLKFPGEVLGYAEITAPVNVASTTEATGTSIVVAPSVTTDGSTVIVVEFFAPYVSTPTVIGQVFISLFEGATQIGRLAVVQNDAAAALAVPVLAQRRFTPSAAAHVFTITAHASATTGTPAVGAGASGTGAYMPAYVKVMRF